MAIIVAISRIKQVMSFDWLEQLKIRTYILIIMEIISFLSGGGEVGLKSLSWNYFLGGHSRKPSSNGWQ